MSRWIETSREAVTQSFLFNFLKVRFRSEATSKTGVFDVLETKDWVNVIAITDKNEVVMVRQFRFGTQTLSLEFPAGIVEENELPSVAAARELLEETGSSGPSMESIGRCRPNPAFLTNTCHHFLARGVKFHSAQSLDEQVTHI